MPSVFPILLLGGAAVMLTGGKKRRKKPPKLVGDSCASLGPEVHAVKKTEGLICDYDSGDWVEESELDEAPVGEDTGEFEVEEEGLSPSEDEDLQAEEEIERATFEAKKDPSKICEEFLSAIHVDPTEPGELPINEIAVNETVLPTMKLVMGNLGQTHGKPLDPEIAGPQMVRQALAALVPACEWMYDDTNGEFIYNNTHRIEGQQSKEVLYGLMELSRRLLDEYNQPATQPGQGLGLVGAS